MAHNAAAALERTIDALEAQTTPPQRTVMVHIDSRDETLALMRAHNPDLIVTVEAGSSFGDAVGAAIEEFESIVDDPIDPLDDEEPPNDWFWLLGADNAPEPDALAELLDTAERNPSLEVTGPKLIAVDDPTVLVEYGQSMTGSGISLRLHEHALDQGQFEHLSDVLAVAGAGMLVRRDTWARLGGFDPGLDSYDDALDFCVRTWLSDGRVLLTPDARVESMGDLAPGTARLGRRTRQLARYRLQRTAQLHRQLKWSSPIEFVLRWLLLLPTAIGRAVMHLLRKQPGRILPDLRAALAVAFGRTRAARARRSFAEGRRHPMSTLDRLLVSRAEWRKLQANLRDEDRAVLQQGRDRFNFITGGGGWVLLIAAIASIVLLFPLLRTGTIAGGALRPLSGSLGELWANTGYGLRDTGGGVGVADPFQFLLAVLGSITFWQPSLIVTVLWVAAMPVAAVGAWFMVARFTRRPWLRAFAALAWAIAPSLHVALADGRLGGVIVHMALPWLVFTAFAASRSWAAAATASLLVVVVAACSPMLMPALAAMWVFAMVRSGRGWVRQIFLPVPALAMFLPLGVTQFNRGRPLALFADPGMPLAVEPVRGWHAALGFADASLGGWPELLDRLGWSLSPVLVLAALLIPLALLVLAGVLGPGWRLGLAGLGAAALGLVTAGIAGGFELAATGGGPVPLWIGPAQSFGWLGLLVVAVAGAVALGPLRAPVTVLALLAAVALVVPVAPAQFTGAADVEASDGRTLPALVDAQGRAAGQLGTLIVSPLGPQEMRVHLERGSGQKLDQYSTLVSTNPGQTQRRTELAELAVGFLSSGVHNPTAELHRLGIGFVLVEGGPTGGAALEQRMITALSTNESMQIVGQAGDFGTLFQVVNAAERPTDPGLATQLETSNWQNVLGRVMLIVQSAVLLFVVLLALPTGVMSSRARAAAIRSGERWEELDRERPRRRSYRLDDETVDVYADSATGDLTGQEPWRADAPTGDSRD